jgi:hypothetical protein
MEKYIIVKVRDADAEFPSSPYKDLVTGKWHIPLTNLGKIRKAIHTVAEEHFISEADMVTHTWFMTKAESDAIARIFETAMSRAKRRTTNPFT